MSFQKNTNAGLGEKEIGRFISVQVLEREVSVGRFKTSRDRTLTKGEVGGRRKLFA
jgi:hypothetical protein